MALVKGLLGSLTAAEGKQPPAATTVATVDSFQVSDRLQKLACRWNFSLVKLAEPPRSLADAFVGCKNSDQQKDADMLVHGLEDNDNIVVEVCRAWRKKSLSCRSP